MTLEEIRLAMNDYPLFLLEHERTDVVNMLLREPRSAYYQAKFKELQEKIYNHHLTKKLMNKELTLKEQILENHNNGLFTLITNSDGEYLVLSTMDRDGDLRSSGWYSERQESLHYIGCGGGDDLEDIDDMAEEEGWEIVEAFNPSDYMKECSKKNTKEIKDAIETLKKAGMVVDGKILNLS